MGKNFIGQELPEVLRDLTLNKDLILLIADYYKIAGIEQYFQYCRNRMMDYQKLINQNKIPALKAPDNSQNRPAIEGGFKRINLAFLSAAIKKWHSGFYLKCLDVEQAYHWLDTTLERCEELLYVLGHPSGEVFYEMGRQRREYKGYFGNPEFEALSEDLKKETIKLFKKMDPDFEAKEAELIRIREIRAGCNSRHEEIFQIIKKRIMC